MSPPTQYVSAGFAPEMLDDLDAIASVTGLSRSELIRQACGRYVEAWYEARRKKPGAKKQHRVKPRVSSRRHSEWARSER